MDGRCFLNSSSAHAFASAHSTISASSGPDGGRTCPLHLLSPLNQPPPLSVTLDLPVAHPDDAVGLPADGGGVSNHDYGLIVLFAQPGQKLHDLGRSLTIQVACGFIGPHDCGSGHDPSLGPLEQDKLRRRATSTGARRQDHKLHQPVLPGAPG